MLVIHGDNDVLLIAIMKEQEPNVMLGLQNNGLRQPQKEEI